MSMRIISRPIGMLKRPRARRRDRDRGRLSTEQRNDIFGLLLFALAACLILSLVPPSTFGVGVLRLFPNDNFMGIVGLAIQRVSTDLLGVGRIFLPAPPLVGALACFGLLRIQAALRWAYFLGGLVVLFPLGAYQFTADAGSMIGADGSVIGGWLGREIGFVLAALLGWFGALLLITILLALYSIITLQINPFRVVGRLLYHVFVISSEAAARWYAYIRERLMTRSLANAVKTVEGQQSFDPLIDHASTWESAAHEDSDSGHVDISQSKEIADNGLTTELPPQIEQIINERSEAPTNSAPLPSTELLTIEPSRETRITERELDSLGQTLIHTLNTFRIESRIVGRTTGPVVTQFELVPAPGIKVSRIASLDADLALALKASSVRIVAPIPGKGAVGIEVPNPVPEKVFLREILESEAFRGNRGALPLALGKDLHGRPYVADLARMPHLLIAGATGSGKSVCINTIITSLIYRHGPTTLRLLMVDPKMVELSMYGDLPHLRHPVVTDPNDAAHVLKWAVLEMERRYKLLSINGARSIKEFNQKLARGRELIQPGPEPTPYTDGPLPYIVVVVDELADLMMAVQGDVERPLAQLAQKARAIGIHLIVATQRPSVNVITGLIKANFPTRIAFRVASKVDSRTILDQNGAETLLGNGDMLFLPPGTSDPVRIQGAFLTTEDTERLMDWYRQAYANHRVEEENVLEVVRALEESEEMRMDDVQEERDPLFRQAAEICIQFQQGSTSLLQRRLKIGYGRAARIVDQLHAAGILGPPEGSKPREVLVGLDALDLIIGC